MSEPVQFPPIVDVEQPQMYELTFRGPPSLPVPWSWTLQAANEKSPDGERVWLFDVSTGNAGLRIVATDAMLRTLADAIIKSISGIEIARPVPGPFDPRTTA